MPTYEYKCTKCGHRFERWQSMKEDAIKECPACDGETRRILFPVGVIFKGSGFYVTDNRKSGSGSTSDSTAASSSSGSTSSGSSTSGSSNNGDKSESKSESTGAKKEGSTEAAKATSE